MQTQTSHSVLDYALNFASEWGWLVMPLHGIASDGFCTCGNQSCKSEGKHPRTAHGLKDATTDAVQIESWWQQWPDANVGIVTGRQSGIVVLDCDTVKGAKSGDLLFGGVDATAFTTPKVKTGAGMHFYFKYPANVDIPNSASKLAKFIDVRGEGGYVVAPPSLHISGKNYEFLNAVDQLAEFPQQWIDKLLTPNSQQPSPPNGNGNSATQRVNGSVPHSGLFVPPSSSDVLQVPEEIQQGTRNQELTKIAGALRRNGLVENDIYQALVSINARICKPPIDDKELHLIAKSVNRYTPHDVLKAIADPDGTSAAADEDYENTLKPFLYETFLNEVFEEKEILGFHIGKRDIAVVQAATNAGKTTLLRNVALCMTAGRPFSRFYDGVRPIKIAYFDFENDAQDVQRDLAIMDDVFTATEMARIKKNLIVIPKGLMNGELFQFNTHEKWANELIQKNNVEFIIVDNVSAAYDLNDENSNAEVTKKVIKPLLKMAYKGNCAFLFAHHFGKAKQEIDHAGVHAGRGASALQALSRTVINMFGDVSAGEPVTIECAKRKTDGGQKYTDVLKLEADRWFHQTTYAPPPAKPTVYQAIRSLFASIVYPQTVTMAEIMERFENDYSDSSIEKAVAKLVKFGFVDKPKHGEYCGKGQKNTDPPAVNFYEKDDED